MAGIKQSEPRGWRSESPSHHDRAQLKSKRRPQALRNFPDSLQTTPSSILLYFYLTRETLESCSQPLLPLVCLGAFQRFMSIDENKTRGRARTFPTTAQATLFALIAAAFLGRRSLFSLSQLPGRRHKINTMGFCASRACLRVGPQIPRYSSSANVFPYRACCARVEF